MTLARRPGCALQLQCACLWPLAHLPARLARCSKQEKGWLPGNGKIGRFLAARLLSTPFSAQGQVGVTSHGCCVTHRFLSHPSGTSLLAPVPMAGGGVQANCTTAAAAEPRPTPRRRRRRSTGQPHDEDGGGPCTRGHPPRRRPLHALPAEAPGPARAATAAGGGSCTDGHGAAKYLLESYALFYPSSKP